MELTIEEAAAALGRSVRQVRYLIQTGELASHKRGGRILVKRADLDLVDDTRKQRFAKRAATIRDAVDDAVESVAGAEPAKPTFSVRGMRSFQWVLQILGDARLPAGHPAREALRDCARYLTRGCHAWRKDEKLHAYAAARVAACDAATELLLDGTAAEAAASIERDLVRSISGLIARIERR